MVRNLEDKHFLYFEAILQLRDCTPEIIEEAEREIQRSGMRIAKYIRTKNGRDYYLTDGKLTTNLGRRLQERHGGDFKVTSRLYGRKKDSDLYRLTILFRAAQFKKNDHVLYHGEEYLVKMIGKELLLQPIASGKKVHLKYNQLERIKKVNK